MTRRYRSLALLLVVIALAIHSAPSRAQPALVADNGINGGAVMATINEPTAAQCFARCKETAGCSGLQFSGGSLGMNRRSLPGGSCLLFSGAVGLRPLQGVTACVMPCDGSAPRLAGKTFDAGTLKPMDPGSRVVAPGRLLPPRGDMAPVPPPSPPAAYIAPVVPKPGVAVVPALPAQPAPVPAPAPAVARLSGFEIVSGPPARIAPLAISEAGVSCPPGKLAISVGYRVRPTNADPQYGVEVEAAMPEGSNARVRVRNANVFVPVDAEAIAICIDRHPGVRAVDTSVSADSARDLAAEAADCGSDRLIGGGFSGQFEAHQVVNAPLFMNKAGTEIGKAGPTTFGFVSGSIKATPLPGSFKTNVRGICAPAAAVPDWEAVMGSLQRIGGRSAATLTLQCPPGKRMLSAGAAAGGWLRMNEARAANGGPDQLAVWSGGPTSLTGENQPIALIKNTLEPQGVRQPSGITLNGGGTAAFLSNRDIAGNSVSVLLAGVCATVP